MLHAYTLLPVEIWAGMLTLCLVLVAALSTTREILIKGNEADPLRREIEKENREKEKAPETPEPLPKTRIRSHQK